MIKEYTIQSKAGLKLKMTNYGCRMMSLCVPDAQGDFVDVILGYDSAADYQQDSMYHGAIVGRSCNRLGAGRFQINGKTYQLSLNEGENHLHGGVKGLSKELWELKEQTESKLVFSYLSPDKADGYPGNLQIEATFEFKNENELHTNLVAHTDQDTPVNLTMHPYFNLMGEAYGSIEEHEFLIPAETILEKTEAGIVTGKECPVAGTPHDFNSFGKVCFDKVLATPKGDTARGIDDHYVLSGDKICKVKAANGLEMSIETNQRGIQFYTTNFPNGKGKKGLPFKQYGAFCLETQAEPNGINVPQFPSMILVPEEEYRHTTIYRFCNKERA